MDLGILAQACESLLSGQNDFWLLAAITDRSYEEGVRNRGFRESVDSFGPIGISAALSQRLRCGINGNLADTLEEYVKPAGKITRSRSRSAVVAGELVFARR